MSKKDDIFNATLELIVEEGMQAVTMAKILDKASVGSGTLYNYFSSKDELLYELYRQLLRKLSDAATIGYDQTAGVRHRFNQLLTGFMEYIINNFDEYNFIDQYTYFLHKQKPDDPAFINSFSIALGETFIDGQNQSVISCLESHVLIQIATGIIISIVKGYKSNKYELDDLMKVSILDICWNSVRA